MIVDVFDCLYLWGFVDAGCCRQKQDPIGAEGEEPEGSKCHMDLLTGELAQIQYDFTISFPKSQKVFI